ncbi:MAG TPA: outer membrane beta-barrel protein [Vicinamibacterales bacterium]|nr:outer membrane beta-barrel protein [Vicinamibacterales bacterium]
MRFALVPCALLLAATATPAAAQPASFDRGYVHVNFGGQVGSNDLDQPGSFELYEETALFNVRGEIGGGALFDIGGGVRVWRQLYAGVSYSRSSDNSDASLTGMMPDPLIHDRHRPINGAVSGLEHTEHAVHLSAVWRQPVNVLERPIDVALFVGPTFFTVDQDVVTGLTLNEPTPTIAGITTASASESALGFHVGADVAYRVARRVRVGLLLRYAGGSVDLPAAGQETSLDVGGFQVGAGVRVGF